MAFNQWLKLSPLMKSRFAGLVRLAGAEFAAHRVPELSVSLGTISQRVSAGYALLSRNHE